MRCTCIFRRSVCICGNPPESPRIADWEFLWLPMLVFIPCVLIGIGMAVWP